jgi:hypothetical protein
MSVCHWHTGNSLPIPLSRTRSNRRREGHRRTHMYPPPHVTHVSSSSRTRRIRRSEGQRRKWRSCCGGCLTLNVDHIRRIHEVA